MRVTRRLRNAKGQVLIEFALVAILFLLMAMGTYDFGRMILRVHQLTQVAREGARAASTTLGIATTAGQTQIEEKMRRITDGMGIPFGSLNIQVNPVDLDGDGFFDIVDVTTQQNTSEFIGTSIFPILNDVPVTSTISMPLLVTNEA